MSNIVLKAENISKQYRLGQLGTGTISHDINRWFYKIRGKEDPYLKVGDANDRSEAGGSEYVWSLKDIDFEVKRGEVLGIIGKNGAGKSTLLKILSQVTTPTTGAVKVKGRIAALLEVGTGFHPDLTGRENVFLNGAILGMTKREIKSKLDEIVEFSGVAKYLDTPVKRYSSGMMVRLGFAVAAHLEPEILIVDEVLAVGDAEFQKKCIGKMKDVSGQGRTVLFVSHNMNAIRTLCTQGLFLKNGKVKEFGKINPIVEGYLYEGLENKSIRVFKEGELEIEGYCSVMSVKIYNQSKEDTTNFDVLDDVYIEMNYKVLKSKYTYTVHFYIKNSTGDTLFVTMDNKYSPYIHNPQQPGVYKEVLKIEKNFLNEGNYSIEALVCTFPTVVEGKHCTLDNALSFSVGDINSELGARGSWDREWPNSLVRPDFKWEIQKIS